MYDIKLTDDTVKYSTSTQYIDDVKYTKFEFNSINTLGEVRITWKINVSNYAYQWSPGTRNNKQIYPDFSKNQYSKGTINAPVSVFYDENDTVIYSLSCSEIIETVGVNTGVHEEDGSIINKIFLFDEEPCKKHSYSITIRESYVNLQLNKELISIREWYNNLGYENLKPPNSAYGLVYSTWYNFHQNVQQEKIERQLNIAKEFGFKTIILDDGWQTLDNSRGYAFTGDWEVNTEKFPNFKEHVAYSHKLGYKYMVWFSVPFIGYESRNWNKYKNMLLYKDDNEKAGILDTRYAEVRTFLKNIFISMVNEYELDGLKLDFIDMFDYKKCTMKSDASVEITLQESVLLLLKEIKDECMRKNPDFLIEFRQRYIGPSMSTVSNIFRVADCPSNYIANRISICDLRLFSGGTAIHSDMIMWNENSSPYYTALQLYNCFFSVIQYSLDFNKITDEQKKISQFILGYWNQNKNILLHGEFNAHSPHLNYPMVESTLDGSKIITLHEKNIVDIKSKYKKTVIVNCTLSNNVYVNCDEKKIYNIVIYNYIGEKVHNIVELKFGSNIIECEPCSIVEIISMK